MLVFELNNLPLDDEFHLLHSGVVEKRKSRDEFVTSCIRDEFEAFKKTQSFFKEHPLVEANFENSPWYRAIITYRGDFADYLRHLDTRSKNSYDPRKYFGGVYDRYLAAHTGGNMVDPSGEASKGDEERN